MAGQKATTLGDILNLPPDIATIKRYSLDIVSSASQGTLAEYKTQIQSIEVVGANDNHWLILLCAPNVLLPIPQNGLKDPQELKGVDISFLTNHYSYLYYLVRGGDGNSYLCIPNVAEIEVDGQPIYTNHALQVFRENPNKFLEYWRNGGI